MLFWISLSNPIQFTTVINKADYDRYDIYKHFSHLFIKFSYIIESFHFHLMRRVILSINVSVVWLGPEILRIGINKPFVSCFPPGPPSSLREGRERGYWHSVIPTKGEEHVEENDRDVDEYNQREQRIWIWTINKEKKTPMTYLRWLDVAPLCSQQEEGRSDRLTCCDHVLMFTRPESVLITACHGQAVSESACQISCYLLHLALSLQHQWTHIITVTTLVTTFYTFFYAFIETNLKLKIKIEFFFLLTNWIL